MQYFSWRFHSCWRGWSYDCSQRCAGISGHSPPVCFSCLPLVTLLILTRNNSNKCFRMMKCVASMIALSTPSNHNANPQKHRAYIMDGQTLQCLLQHLIIMVAKLQQANTVSTTKPGWDGANDWWPPPSTKTPTLSMIDATKLSSASAGTTFIITYESYPKVGTTGIIFQFVVDNDIIFHHDDTNDNFAFISDM